MTEQKKPKETSLKMQSKITGKGAPLVLVPGGLTGWLSWEPHSQRLATTRKVVRVQLISVEYGLHNRKLPSDYSLRTESVALETTLKEIGLAEPVDIIAWSYGAAIALDYALDHPDKVCTLTLIEPPAFWALGEEEPSGKEYESLVELSRTIHEDVSEEQLEQFSCAVGLCPPGKLPSIFLIRRSLRCRQVMLHISFLWIVFLRNCHRSTKIGKGRNSKSNAIEDYIKLINLKNYAGEPGSHPRTCILAAINVCSINIAIVIGPTPPGTGEISFTFGNTSSKSTSP